MSVVVFVAAQMTRVRRGIRPWLQHSLPSSSKSDAQPFRRTTAFSTIVQALLRKTRKSSSSQNRNKRLAQSSQNVQSLADGFVRFYLDRDGTICAIILNLPCYFDIRLLVSPTLTVIAMYTI